MSKTSCSPFAILEWRMMAFKPSGKGSPIPVDSIDNQMIIIIT